jgi:CubicO group peptidase (beta-lactamase class C family)
MQRCVDEGYAPGLLTLLARHGRVVHLGCFGLMDIEAGKPMQPNAIFRIASMAKPVTAVAVMMLCEEGLFRLDDPISAYLPEFAETRVAVRAMPPGFELDVPQQEITIRHLLTHTSGMCLGLVRDEPVEALWCDAVSALVRTPGVTLRQAARELARLPLAHQPGTAYRYGLSFEVLACLVEIVSGEWFDLFLRHHIFEPLGMKDTGYEVPPEKTHRLAALYAPVEGGGFRLLEAPASSPHVVFAGYEPGTVWTSGGGQMLSTAADYARLTQMLLNGGELDGQRWLHPETVALMTSNCLPETLPPFGGMHAGYGHGLGLRVLLDVAAAGGVGSVGEFTGDGGHGTCFWADPAEELVGLLMLQLRPNPLREIRQKFRSLAYQAVVDG